MGRPDEAQMRRMVKNLAGEAIRGLEDHMANPLSKVVAVERHDRDWRDGQFQTRYRFLWFKAREVSLTPLNVVECVELELQLGRTCRRLMQTEGNNRVIAITN